MDLTIYLHGHDWHGEQDGYALDIYGGSKDVHLKHRNVKHLVKELAAFLSDETGQEGGGGER